jgi:hypothetical protein
MTKNSQWICRGSLGGFDGVHGHGQGPNGGWRGVLTFNYYLVLNYFVTTLGLLDILQASQAPIFWTWSFFGKDDTRPR